MHPFIRFSGVRFSALLSPVAFAAALSGCAHHSSGAVTTQPRSVPSTTAKNVPPGEFSRIELRGDIDVVVHEGGARAISVTGDDDVQKRLATRVEGDTLIVALESDTCSGVCFEVGDDDGAKVSVELPSLRGAKIEGSGDITIEGSGAHAELDFDVAGSGDVHYSGSADVVRCKIDGSGDVVLRGQGKRLEARIQGSGDVRAREFPVEGGVYEIDGSGDVTTAVHGGEMSVKLQGSGDLVYSGQAKITSLDVSGSGEMREADESHEDD